jgi:hypothetical protein
VKVFEPRLADLRFRLASEFENYLVFYGPSPGRVEARARALRCSRPSTAVRNRSAGRVAAHRGSLSQPGPCSWRRVAGATGETLAQRKPSRAFARHGTSMFGVHPTQPVLPGRIPLKQANSTQLGGGTPTLARGPCSSGRLRPRASSPSRRGSSGISRTPARSPPSASGGPSCTRRKSSEPGWPSAGTADFDARGDPEPRCASRSLRRPCCSDPGHRVPWPPIAPVAQSG